MDLWEEKYLEMEKAVGKNREEQEVLAKLRKGYSIVRCMEESRLSYEEFSALLERTGKWETENLCRILTHEGQQICR
ncbi:MAG: hypothetical protein J1E62_04015 [Lachnospiraceae bacterium]|nr:hypothetical protein [Lachnospiraceae bacterium]